MPSVVRREPLYLTHRIRIGTVDKPRNPLKPDEHPGVDWQNSLLLETGAGGFRTGTPIVQGFTFERGMDFNSDRPFATHSAGRLAVKLYDPDGWFAPNNPTSPYQVLRGTVHDAGVPKVGQRIRVEYPPYRDDRPDPNDSTKTIRVVIFEGFPMWEGHIEDISFTPGNKGNVAYIRALGIISKFVDVNAFAIPMIGDRTGGTLSTDSANPKLVLEKIFEALKIDLTDNFDFGDPTSNPPFFGAEDLAIPAWWANADQNAWNTMTYLMNHFGGGMFEGRSGALRAWVKEGFMDASRRKNTQCVLFDGLNRKKGSSPYSSTNSDYTIHKRDQELVRANIGESTWNTYPQSERTGYAIISDDGLDLNPSEEKILNEITYEQGDFIRGQRRDIWESADAYYYVDIGMTEPFRFDLEANMGEVRLYEGKEITDYKGNQVQTADERGFAPIAIYDLGRNTSLSPLKYDLPKALPVNSAASDPDDASISASWAVYPRQTNPDGTAHVPPDLSIPTMPDGVTPNIDPYPAIDTISAEVSRISGTSALITIRCQAPAAWQTDLTLDQTELANARVRIHGAKFAGVNRRGIMLYGQPLLYRKSHTVTLKDEASQDEYGIHSRIYDNKFPWTDTLILRNVRSNDRVLNAASVPVVHPETALTDIIHAYRQPRTRPVVKIQANVAGRYAMEELLVPMNRVTLDAEGTYANEPEDFWIIGVKYTAETAEIAQCELYLRPTSTDTTDAYEIGKNVVLDSSLYSLRRDD